MRSFGVISFLIFIIIFGIVSATHATVVNNATHIEATTALSPENASIVYYNEARTYFSNATELSNNGKLDEANKAFNKSLDAISKALEFNPSYYNALMQKGNILMRLRSYDDALTEFNLAINVDKNSASLRRKGDALLALGQYEDAFSVLNEALSINSTDRRARESLKSTYKMIEGNITKNSGAYFYFKGVTEFYDGDSANASTDLNKSIELNLVAYSAQFKVDADKKLEALRIVGDTKSNIKIS
jgi:tetratricopeptide (TPR) repeat protein